MSIQKFHDSADRLIDTVAKFVRRNIALEGDRPSECQQTAALNALQELSSTFNGTISEELTNAPQTDRYFIELDRAMAESVIEAVNIATMSDRLCDEAALKAQAATTLITDALVN